MLSKSRKPIKQKISKNKTRSDSGVLFGNRSLSDTDVVSYPIPKKESEDKTYYPLLVIKNTNDDGHTIEEYKNLHNLDKNLDELAVDKLLGPVMCAQVVIYNTILKIMLKSGIQMIKFGKKTWNKDNLLYGLQNGIWKIATRLTDGNDQLYDDAMVNMERSSCMEIEDCIIRQVAGENNAVYNING